jgi:hypothetical protein
MKASAILTSALGRRQARKIKRELNEATVAAAAITAHTVRHMRRLAWEGDRSPSQLGRAGERAEQAHKFIIPAAASATAIVALASAIFDLYVKYEEWRNRPDSTAANTVSGEESDKPAEPSEG